MIYFIIIFLSFFNLSQSFGVDIANPKVLSELAINESEKLAAKYEKFKLDKIFSLMKSKNIEVHGFYHVSEVNPYWKDVVEEQLKLLDGYRKFPQASDTSITHHPNATAKGNPYINYGDYHWDTERKYSSLLEKSTSLNINYGIPYDIKLKKFEEKHFDSFKSYIHSLNLHNDAKINFSSFNSVNRDSPLPDNNSSIGEYTSILNLHNFCLNKQEANPKKRHIVYYFHNKASCCHVKGNNDPEYNKYMLPRAMWREYMNAVNLEFPSICMRAIGLKSYSTCGTQRLIDHYSGNFWWADCDHITKLPKLTNPTDFMASEFFIFHFSNKVHEYINTCGFSFDYLNQNMYDVPGTRDLYRQRLYEFSSKLKDFPPSRGYMNVNANSNTTICSIIRNQSEKFDSKSLNKLFKELFP